MSAEQKSAHGEARDRARRRRAQLMPDVVAALLPPLEPIALESAAAVKRRDVSREIARAEYRALWRAERRSRRKPYGVRHSLPWVNSQRRLIAKEVIRHLRSLGAGRELARAIATRACERFPKDGIVLEDARRRPRALGTAPRLLGENPRARGESPRQLGRSPRQRRAPSDLSELSLAAAAAHLDPAGAEMPAAAPPTSSPAAAAAPPRSIDELAPGWSALKQELVKDLAPHERLRAKQMIADDARRLKEARSQREPSSTTT